MAMNDNLARNYNVNPIPKKEEQPQVASPIKKQAGQRSKASWFAISRIEKLILSVLGSLIFFVSLFTVASGVQMNAANIRLQDAQSQAEALGIENENLEQNIQELTQYDRIHDIAKQNNLNMNEENVRNVSK